MSVQAGVWNLDGTPPDQEFMARISRELAAYGPDGEAAFVAGPIGMIHRPLHTTKESRLERQPHLFGRGKILMWDGRLDNREDLLSRLSHILKGDFTDVAIVGAAFDQWGTNCFAELVGDWAISIWDRHENELILARDYIGVRHLFYHHTVNRIIWCSHLAPLFLCGDPLTLCEEYIAGYLSSWPEGHLTPYREICSVASGNFVRIRRGQFSEHSYWSFNPQLHIRYKTDQEYEEHFRHLFRQSVRRRLRSDSPILAELSGGLDSSSIVSMADEILADKGHDHPSVDTFSSYDADEPDDDDPSYFGKIEEKRGRVGYHAQLKSIGNTLGLGQEAFIATPGFSHREEWAAAESRVIESGKYRVVLSGDGGDQLLGQTRNPRVQVADRLAHFRLLEMNKLLIGWSLYTRRPWVRLLFQSLSILMPLPVAVRTRSLAKRQPWVQRNFALRNRIEDNALPTKNGTWLWFPSARESLQILRDLAGFVTAARPCAFERRYPFLDQNLTEFLISIPLDQLTRPGQQRSLMRRALVSIVPDEILKRRTKAGCGRCDILSLRKHWNMIAGICDSPVSSRLGYIDRDRFAKALSDMKDGAAPARVVRLLKVLSLEVWLRDCIARQILFLEKSGPQDYTTTKARAPALAQVVKS